MSKHIHIHAFVVAAFLAAMFVSTALPAAAGSCESLAGLKLPDTTITMAQSVAAGAFTVPAAGRGAAPRFDDLPAFCRVAATLKPSTDSDIKIEVWLPGGPRNGREGQGDRCGLLWQWRPALLLQWLLGRWKTGTQGSAAFPGGFRRHHRRRTGTRYDGPGGVLHVCCSSDAQGRS